VTRYPQIMRRSSVPKLPPFAVVVFGDGRLPEVLLTCLQFRLVADLVALRRVDSGQLQQLHGHINHGCGECRGYLVGRLTERGAPPRPES
jgi:hypothetical protein